MELLLAPHNLPFTVALGLVALGSVLQILLGVGDAISLDGDLEADLPGGTPWGALLDFLGVGRIPSSIWLILFGLGFSFVGFALQLGAQKFLEAPFSPLLASLAALIASLPLVKTAGFVLKPLLPHDHTEAVLLETLVGREAQITVGTARRGRPAEARVLDKWGHPHYVMVEPELAETEFPTGSKILLIAKRDHIFRATDFSGAQLGE